MNAHLYVGSWGFKASVEGLQAFSLDTETMTAESIGRFGSVKALSGTAMVRVGGEAAYILAIEETKPEGKILSFRKQEDGTLIQTDELEVSGTSLSYIEADPFGPFAYVSSMGSGTVLMVKVDADGKLRVVDTQVTAGHSILPRQQRTAIHSVKFSPDGSLLAACNLGSDEILIYRVERESEKLVRKQVLFVDFGQGPRHMAFHPSGRFLYVTTEIGSRVLVYEIRDGVLTLLAQYPSGDPFRKEGMMASDLVMDGEGKYLYTANRNQNTIGVFKVLEGGYLVPVGFYDCGGENPRGLLMGVDKHSILCCNNDTDSVDILARDPETGAVGEKRLSISAEKPNTVRIF